MLTIQVEFLHGVLRAGSPDDIAMTGHDDPGEWPPSPARLFSALVGAGGTGVRAAAGDGSELRLLETADPPEIIADLPAQVLSSAVCSRFVVADELHVDTQTRETGAVHEYIARRAALVRPGTRLAPKTPEVAYVWPELSPSREQLASIAFRAARVSYLGCADSPVRLTVSCELAGGVDGRWVPDALGRHPEAVPYPGFTDALDRAFEQWLQAPVRRAWLRTRRVLYRQPGETTIAPPCEPSIHWLLLDPPVPGRFALALTETLRAATLDLHERHSGAVPSILHGHGFRGSGQNHAQFLALPDVGFPHSSGHIHGAAVWLPANSASDTAASLRAALWHLHELVCPGRFRTAVKGHGGEQRPVAANPGRWTQPSKHWVSALPVVHERWISGGPDCDEVASWFRHAGFECRVLETRNSVAPLLPGSVRLRPEQVHRQGRGRHPYSFLDVRLDREIAGPIVIGQGRQFGMGLMAPKT